jgi:hypothetical protein
VANKFTINPVNHSRDGLKEGDFNAYILWYVREPPARATTVPAPVVAGPVVAGAVDTRSIAERLVERKRAARG